MHAACSNKREGTGSAPVNQIHGHFSEECMPARNVEFPNGNAQLNSRRGKAGRTTHPLEGGIFEGRRVRRTIAALAFRTLGRRSMVCRKPPTHGPNAAVHTPSPKCVNGRTPRRHTAFKDAKHSERTRRASFCDWTRYRERRQGTEFGNQRRSAGREASTRPLTRAATNAVLITDQTSPPPVIITPKPLDTVSNEK